MFFVSSAILFSLLRFLGVVALFSELFFLLSSNQDRSKHPLVQDWISVDCIVYIQCLGALVPWLLPVVNSMCNYCVVELSIYTSRATVLTATWKLLCWPIEGVKTALWVRVVGVVSSYLRHYIFFSGNWIIAAKSVYFSCWQSYVMMVIIILTS